MARSHGTGLFDITQFAAIKEGVIFETGVLVFHPEKIRLGRDIYIGHFTILKGYYKNEMVIGDGTWIGQQCFFHSGGGLVIGKNVGIGPGVKILTSSHRLDEIGKPILHSEVIFSPVSIGDGSDIGVGAIILPGVTIGKGAQIGAGAVVSENVDDFCIAVGVPARVIRSRR